MTLRRTTGETYARPRELWERLCGESTVAVVIVLIVVIVLLVIGGHEADRGAEHDPGRVLRIGAVCAAGERAVPVLAADRERARVGKMTGRAVGEELC